MLEDAGYTGLSESFVDDAQRYSFVFDGFSGELDHGLAGPDLVDNVTGATIWHSNADEPLILDYNTEFNPPGLYQPDAYRASDHDPLIVGLQLAEEATVPEAPAVSVLPGWGAATVEWEAPDDGGSAITGYEVRALVRGNEVASATLGPEARSHTFGQLDNGRRHTFEVVASNDVGAGPAGSASATPFVPRHPRRLDVGGRVSGVHGDERQRLSGQRLLGDPAPVVAVPQRPRRRGRARRLDGRPRRHGVDRPPHEASPSGPACRLQDLVIARC